MARQIEGQAGGVPQGVATPHPVVDLVVHLDVDELGLGHEAGAEVGGQEQVAQVLGGDQPQLAAQARATQGGVQGGGGQAESSADGQAQGRPLLLGEDATAEVEGQVAQAAPAGVQIAGGEQVQGQVHARPEAVDGEPGQQVEVDGVPHEGGPAAVVPHDHQGVVGPVGGQAQAPAPPGVERGVVGPQGGLAVEGWTEGLNVELGHGELVDVLGQRGGAQRDQQHGAAPP